MFNQSVFSFALCDAEEEQIKSRFPIKENIGRYILFVDDRTPLQRADGDGRTVIIYGYAVDVFSGQSENLAETLLKSAKSVNDVIEYEKKLGGKYLIFWSEGDKCYCLGDATCSIPLFYTVGLSGIRCCSNPQMIVSHYSLQPDAYLQDIRDSGPINQAMPFDVTPYKEIKQLIPNHYVDFSAGESLRFVNSTVRQKQISPQRAAEITAPMIEKLAEFYLKKFNIYCPLTSGRDSRVVYAYLKKVNPDIESYTIWHDRFKKDDQDWKTPLKLAELTCSKHEQIYKEELTQEKIEYMDSILGVDGYPKDAFVLSVTVNKHFSDSATVEGDIIGQVGKCSLHRNIPQVFATPAYFRCKLHNYSSAAKDLLGLWIDEIRENNEKVNPFDLFSVENRLGVWASHTHLIRNVMGQMYVNIFNSRSIIYTWTAVNRAERMKSKIHIALIEQKYPELLSVPFEQDSSGLVSFAKSNSFVFYFASFAKYFVQKIKFKKNNK